MCDPLRVAVLSVQIEVRVGDALPRRVVHEHLLVNEGVHNIQPPVRVGDALRPVVARVQVEVRIGFPLPVRAVHEDPVVRIVQYVEAAVAEGEPGPPSRHAVEVEVVLRLTTAGSVVCESLVPRKVAHVEPAVCVRDALRPAVVVLEVEASRSAVPVLLVADGQAHRRGAVVVRVGFVRDRIGTRGVVVGPGGRRGRQGERHGPFCSRRQSGQ